MKNPLRGQSKTQIQWRKKKNPVPSFRYEERILFEFMNPAHWIMNPAHSRYYTDISVL